MIYKVQDYLSEDGRMIRSHIPMLDGADVARTLPKYVGTAMINIKSGKGVQQRSLQFVIEADSIEQAFERFQEAGHASVAQQEAELKKRALAASLVDSPILLPRRGISRLN